MMHEGQSRGGKTRAANQSPEQRKELARKAAVARWNPKTREDKQLKELDKMEKQVDERLGANNEVASPDAPKVFRRAGLSEEAIAKGVRKLAEKAKSEVVRLRAYELACKVLRMLDKEDQEMQGITIVFEAADQAGQPVSTLPPAQAEQAQPISYQVTGKVLQITR